jgi:N-acetylglucosaminyl-diphospho-decaprenol L-rhamnosyltransferase
VRETAIVIVSYRTGDTLARCLDAAHADAPEATIYLVDHESRMVALDALLKPRLWVRPMETNENPGFGAGANRGIDRAFADGFERVLLLNDDVFVQRGCVQALKGAVGADGAASPWLAGEGDAAYRGGVIDWDKGYAGHQEGATDYLIGGCMMITREAWRRTGGFDESFFLYCEDVDWCIRARESGTRIIVVPRDLAIHVGGASTTRDGRALWAYWWARNRLRLLRKHRRGRPEWIAFRQIARSARHIVLAPREVSVATARVRGAIAGLRDRL